MKKILVTVFAISFLACNSEKAPETMTEAKPNVPANMSGFTPTYSASFVMDSAANTETVLALWKEWNDGDLSGSRPHFADSVTFFLADGSMMSGPSDSIIKNMQGYRSSFKNMHGEVEAIFAVKSTDKDENWVAVWGHEINTNMEGKTDTISQQETWRFNKAGKVDLMFQANRKGMIPPPPTN
ncbi:MAG: nuclear transport factor 2 family protein [Bacteroidia bacterium]|nr:nuclear transport factor 2 family protein [Bacteroidia bacterium]